MKSKIKLKGQLRNYMYWPLLLTILLVIINIPVYVVNIKLGALFTGFVVLYFIIVLCAYWYNKPVILNELINFATRYGTVQRRLLDEFEVPYALLDYNGKILWVNQKFTEITGKDKDYHKSITSIFSSLTREAVQKGNDKLEMNLNFQEKHYRASMRKLYFDTVTDDDSVISVEQGAQFMTVLYLFDETQLHDYAIENREQKMVCGLMYIDNYE